MADRLEMLAVLADSTRQTVISLLRQGPSTVGELAEKLPVSRPAVSQHLQVLKAAGLLEEERRGTRHYFRLNAKSLAELRDHIDAMWRDALTAFSGFASQEGAHERQRQKQKRKPGRRTH
jgi:DNA-binding transcriptional ArsR family regulator